MLTRKSKANDNDLFQVPFSGVLPWYEFKEMYPIILTEMDGTCKENCLLFYYDKNVVNKVYQFRDYDTEFDVANILEIDMNITIEGESIEEKETRSSKSCNDISSLIDNQEHNKICKNNTFNDLNSLDAKKTKEEIKKAKKERRLQKLSQRTSAENNIEI
jgi:hypothetical protein